MRLGNLFQSAVALSAAAVLLSGCSGSPQGNPASALPIAYSGAHRAQPGAILHSLYVSDGDIQVLRYRTWANLGTITNGIVTPLLLWVGTNGNLYVANHDGSDITEYDPSGNLVFTYNAGMFLPAGVTTDGVGNIYEGDYAGIVNEYAEGANTVIGHCSVGGAILGVAVDKHGNVFVDYEAGGSFGSILEFRHGLTGSHCIKTIFPVTLGSFGGIAFDSKDNLVVADSGSGAVDVIAPPYISITGTLGSGYVKPIDVTLNRGRTRAYVSDEGSGSVQVVTYPGGMPIATIGSTYGISFPVSAVDSDNYVP